MKINPLNVKLYDTQNLGIFQLMDDICGSTYSTFNFKKKSAYLNEAMDWYKALANGADRQHPFDDSSETSPPILSQNIVSGTNRYKLSAFSDEVLNIQKIEILNSDGQGVQLTEETLDELGDSFQELYIDTANTGTPSHYIKYGDFIYLRPFPDYSETSGLLAYIDRPTNKFSFVSCVAEADDEKITAVAHGLSANDTVVFETDGTLPTGITANTQYYVISTGLTADVFEVSMTQGGSAVNITADGSGNHFLKTNTVPGVPTIHHRMLARKASIPFLTKVVSNKLSLVIQQSVNDEREIEDYFANRSKDIFRGLSVHQENNK